MKERNARFMCVGIDESLCSKMRLLACICIDMNFPTRKEMGIYLFTELCLVVA